MFKIDIPTLHEKIDSASLDPALADPLKDFLTEFDRMPVKPYTINPIYMGFTLNFLVEDICSEGQPPHLWWEMYLALACKWAADRGKDGEVALALADALEPLLRQRFPNDDSTVTLQEITDDTVRGIIMLSETLSEEKRYYVAPNCVSLAQAHFNPLAWFRAIHAGRMPIGFVMLAVNEAENEYFVWRLMIGGPFHSRGYGRKAMEAIKAHVRTLPGATRLELSYGQGPGSPEGFYNKLGFVPTGKVEHGEVYAGIEL